MIVKVGTPLENILFIDFIVGHYKISNTLILMFLCICLQMNNAVRSVFKQMKLILL